MSQAIVCLHDVPLLFHHPTLLLFLNIVSVFISQIHRQFHKVTHSNNMPPTTILTYLVTLTAIFTSFGTFAIEVSNPSNPDFVSQHFEITHLYLDYGNQFEEKFAVPTFIKILALFQLSFHKHQNTPPVITNKLERYTMPHTFWDSNVRQFDSWEYKFKLLLF